jgi:hypothetical protein
MYVFTKSIYIYPLSRSHNTSLIAYFGLDKRGCFKYLYIYFNKGLFQKHLKRKTCVVMDIKGLFLI